MFLHALFSFGTFAHFLVKSSQQKIYWPLCGQNSSNIDLDFSQRCIRPGAGSFHADQVKGHHSKVTAHRKVKVGALHDRSFRYHVVCGDVEFRSSERPCSDL